MTDDKLPQLGKIHPEFFDKIIYPRLGYPDPSVIIRPQHGIDFGVVELGDYVLSMSTDPFFIVPSFGWKRAAWFAFHIITSDVVVSGLKPRYLVIDLNLPPETTEEALTDIWQTVHDECAKYEIAVVTGHTARYAGCNFPMVGGATVIGVGSKDELIDPRSVQIGDKIVITKGPAIETTGIFAIQFPEFLEETYGTEFVKDAQDVFYQMSTVDDALIARQVQGVHAMHDATECGVFGGLFEMSRAGGYGMRIAKSAIPIQEVVKKTCERFDIDPYISISEGTLLAVVAPERADELVSALAAHDIPAAVVGEVLPAHEGITLEEEGKVARIEHPKVDPYWLRFEEYFKKQQSRSPGT